MYKRQHQKVVEFTPSLCLTEEKRNAICEDALKIARSVNYRSAGTVEFLLDKHGNHYFIEMNPRIQVEHTVTEMVTGIDIVQSQIYVAEGYPCLLYTSQNQSGGAGAAEGSGGTGADEGHQGRLRPEGDHEPWRTV